MKTPTRKPGRQTARLIWLHRLALVAGAAVAVLAIGPSATRLNAAPRLCDDGTRPPCNTEGEEAAANRLSYPVILPENQAPAGFPTAAPWTFATITDPTTQCFTGNTGGQPVDGSFDCYYDGAQVWWLSQRTANFWKAFSIAPQSGTGSVLVTALDAGDLLESSPNLNLRKIRIEFTLYQDATLDDRFSPYIPSFDAFGEISYPFAAPCANPATGVDVGCFAALRMSGAVPGTEQSINEIQGTDFGVNTADGTMAQSSASGVLIDPTTVKTATADTADIPVHATVYSNCARLVIQQLGTAVPVWNSATGMWANAASPVVNVATYADLGVGGVYSAEINASGTAVYGYNWNATRDSNGPGDYRITFVLDGSPRCPSLNAAFGDSLTNPDGTFVVNRGEVSTTHIVPGADLSDASNVYGGLAYVDVNITKKGRKSASDTPNNGGNTPGNGPGGGGNGPGGGGNGSGG